MRISFNSVISKSISSISRGYYHYFTDISDILANNIVWKNEQNTYYFFIMWISLYTQCICSSYICSNDDDIYSLSSFVYYSYSIINKHYSTFIFYTLSNIVQQSDHTCFYLIDHFELFSELTFDLFWKIASCAFSEAKSEYPEDQRIVFAHMQHTNRHLDILDRATSSLSAWSLQSLHCSVSLGILHNTHESICISQTTSKYRHLIICTSRFPLSTALDYIALFRLTLMTPLGFDGWFPFLMIPQRFPLFSYTTIKE